MADAAKAARGSFNDIKQGAGEMGASTSGSMMEARHGVMLLGEEFGVHLPRGITMFLSSLGPIGALMEAAFPFLAIVVGATLLLQHLAKLREEGEKLTESQLQFGTVTANVLNELNDKLLQAGIRTDELNGNHLEALEKQLQLIDHQSLKELEHSFEQLAKASDATMALLSTSWYQFGSGSAGAKHALDEFKAKYDLLLAQGKDKEASDLLKGTLDSAEKIQRLQATANGKKDAGDFQEASYMKFEAARGQLKQQNIGLDEKAVQAQNTLVDALQAQVAAEQKVHDLKKLEDSNATGTTQKAIDADDDKLARQRMQEQKRAQEEEDRLYEEHYKEVVAGIQEAEQEKIAATDKGSQERLNAIDAAIKEENAKGLQATGYYKELLKDRVNTAREIQTEQDKLQAEAGKESADHDLKMGELKVAAERETGMTRLAQALQTGRERIEAERQLENEEFQLQQAAYQKEIQALDRYAQDFQNRKKALEDKEAELERAHQNKLQQIQDQGAQQQYSKLTSSMIRMEGEFAKGFTSVLMRHESFASMMSTLGGEVVSEMLQTAIKSAMAMDFGKEKEAAAAARKMFIVGTKFPFPANIIMPEVLGAMAFASVMAFAEGGLVPGVGIGDIQPAMLTPGETVLPKKMTEQLSRAANPEDGGQHVHVHHTSHFTVHAIDGASVKGMLDKHADTFHKHFESHVRRMNR